MEVHFHHHATNTQPAFRKAINAKIYGNNPFLKRVNYVDFLAFSAYFAVLMWLGFKLVEWQETFIEYDGNNFIMWAVYALIFSFGLMVNYACSQRPAWLNQAFYQGVNTLLSGKTLVRLQDNGLFHQTNVMETVYYYPTIQAIEHIEDYLVIMIGINGYIAIAYSDFDSPEHRAEFERLLKQKIAQQAMKKDFIS